MVDPMPMIPQEEAPATQAAPSGGPTSVPAEASESGSESDMMSMLEERVNELPDNQKEFLLQYVQAPEVVAVLGLVLGNEAVEFFAPYSDPGKTVQIVPRPQEQLQAQAQAAPQGPQAGPMAPAAPTQSAPTQGVSMAPGA